MSIEIQRPSGGVDVTRFNARDVLYLRGSEFVDGSIRFIVLPGESVGQIEFRSLGVWNDTNFRVDILDLGRDLALKPAGGFVETINPSAVSGSIRSFLPNIPFDDSTGTGTPILPVALKLFSSINVESIVETEDPLAKKPIPFPNK